MLKLHSFGYLSRRTDTFEKTLMLGKIEGRRRRGATEDKMVGWHHQLDRHEFEQALGVGDWQGSLECCSPWGCRVGHDWATELSDYYFHFLWQNFIVDPHILTTWILPLTLLYSFFLTFLSMHPSTHASYFGCILAEISIINPYMCEHAYH